MERVEAALDRVGVVEPVRRARSAAVHPDAAGIYGERARRRLAVDDSALRSRQRAARHQVHVLRRRVCVHAFEQARDVGRMPVNVYSDLADLVGRVRGVRDDRIFLGYGIT